MLVFVKNATDPDQQVHITFPQVPSPFPKIVGRAKSKDFYALALNFCNQQLQMAATHSASQTQVCQIPSLHE